jgi:hypothetical protein
MTQSSTTVVSVQWRPAPDEAGFVRGPTGTKLLRIYEHGLWFWDKMLRQELCMTWKMLALTAAEARNNQP